MTSIIPQTHVDMLAYLAIDVQWPDGITKEQKEIILKNEFYMPKIIDGQLCALHRYFATVGLVVNIDYIGMERRYCYEFEHDAIDAMRVYENVSEHATGPWIKCKGAFKGDPIDLFNPNLSQ